MLILVLSGESYLSKQIIQASEPDNLYALSACLMDADSGRVLFEKNGTKHRANASTTKIMTLILTLENADMDSLVTVSEYAARQPDVQLNINTGEQYLLRDLCYSLMLESHNDSAVAIAEHVGGSVEQFAKMMTAKAKEIGCTDTLFLTPNGLDAKNESGSHGTTAVDLARIMSYCIMRSPKKAEFLEITRTPSYTFSNKVTGADATVSDGARQFTCHNHNAFLQMMDGALSGKTGFTGEAGYCYVGAVKRDDRTFVVALLGCGWPGNKNYKWKDTRKLMQYGIDYYQKTDWHKQRKKQNIPESIRVCNAKTDSFLHELDVSVDIIPDDSYGQTDTVLKREDEAITVRWQLEKKVEAPISMGEVVGNLEYRIGDELIGRELFVGTKTVERIDFAWNFFIVLKKILL